MFSQERYKEWWEMQEGTKKLFPTDYDRFKETMISAANDNSLPVALQLDDIRDYTLKGLQDAFQISTWIQDWK